MKKFYLIAALLGMTLTASAQVKKTGKVFLGSSYVTPRQFSYGNNPTIHTRGIENYGSVDEKTIFTIYNDDIEKVRSFEVSGYRHEYRVETQQKKPEVTVSDESRSQWYGPYSTWEEAKAYMEAKTDCSYHSGYKFYPTTSGYNYYYSYDSYAGTYDYYDYKYPNYYFEWDSSDGYIYGVNVSYYLTNHYTGEWETTNTNTYTNGWIEEMLGIDYDENTYPDDECYLTQTLFNTDEKFEYIRWEYDDNATDIYDERDRDGDGEIDFRYVKYGGACTGFSIVQEDGTVLQTINCNESDGLWLVKINGKRYLIGDELISKDENGNQTWGDVWYRIDPSTNSVKRIEAPMGMVVRPAVAGRNSQVTVELDGDAREIQVVNAAGQTVKRIPVGEGQRQVTFNTRGLGSGVNVVRATGRNAENSRKFIVK